MSSRRLVRQKSPSFTEICHDHADSPEIAAEKLLQHGYLPSIIARNGDVLFCAFAGVAHWITVTPELRQRLSYNNHLPPLEVMLSRPTRIRRGEYVYHKTLVPANITWEDIRNDSQPYQEFLRRLEKKSSKEVNKHLKKLDRQRAHASLR